MPADRWARIGRFPPYVLLLPVSPAATIFAANTGRLSIGHVVLTAFTLLGGYVLVRVVLRRIFRRHPMIDVCLAAAVLLLTWRLYPYSRIGMDAAFAVAGGVAVAAAWFAEKPRRSVEAVLTILPLVNIGTNGLVASLSPVWSQRGTIEARVQAARFQHDDGLDATRTETRDVYYLVLDRYARADQLQSVYGFDNRPFLEALRSRGFVIADQAYSNYQRTIHSLASSLNFDYLDDLDTDATRGSADWLPLYRMLDDTRSARFFKSHGYRFHYFGSWWEPTRSNSAADVTHNWYSWPEALRTIYETSAFLRTARLAGVKSLDPLWMQCQRTHRMFETLAGLDDDRPMFVFAHFLVPHPPFVVHESGRCMDLAEARSRTRAQNYVGQVQFANGRILAFVDEVLHRPGPKPVIVLQSDEGPWPGRYAGDEVSRLGADVSDVDWRRATAPELREKMAIFSAYYLPDANEHVAAVASPVNTFRRLLRAYFGVRIDLLPDRHFVYEQGSDLYRFREVTATLLGDLPPR